MEYSSLIPIIKMPSIGDTIYCVSYGRRGTKFKTEVIAVGRDTVKLQIVDPEEMKRYIRLVDRHTRVEGVFVRAFPLDMFTGYTENDIEFYTKPHRA